MTAAPGRALVRLAAVWVGLLAAGLAAGLIVEGNGFDGSLVRSVAGERSPAATASMRVATNLGGLWLDVLFAGVVLALLLAGRRADAVLVLVAAGGAMLLTNATKFILERPRPAGGGLVSVSSPSWPSGHASSSIAFYGVLAALAARRAPPGGRPAIWLALAALTGLVGASRVYLGVHYPTDVAAGWALGGLWLVGVLCILGPPARG